MFRFGFTEFLYAYLLVPVLGAFLWYAFRLRQRAVGRFGEVELMRRLSESVSSRGRLAKTALLLITVLLLVTALARPQFGTRVETVSREGQDLIVALDVSASMLAEDIAPNRLEKAKHAVRSLLDLLEGDRVGLVAFAGEAFVQAPLTVDYGAAAMFLNAMGPDLIPLPGTNLGQALETSLDAFEAGQRQHQILVVITDGEDHEGVIDGSVQRAVEEGIRIYTVGIGSADGVPIPDFDASGRRRGFKRDENGEVVTTRLDEATLRDVADATGGRYFRASVSESELDQLVEEIAELGGRELDAQELTQFEEQYQIFLGFGLVVLLIEFLVPERRRVTTAWTGRFQ
jgi:Ca-activated chloride channel family protein